MALLLNPKVWIAAGLAGLILFMWADIQHKKATIADREAKLEVAEQKIATFQGEVTSLNGIIADLERNIADIRKQAAKWKQIASETTDMYRRIVANQDSEKPCEVIDAEYKQMAFDITDQFNNSVRGKVKHPAADGDHPEAKILPPPGPPAGTGKAGDAGAAGR